jgi:hypothetical protein
MDSFESSLQEAKMILRKKKSQPHILVRPITPKECPWLERTYEIGEIVFKYYGHTFGCIGKKGFAFCTVINSLPFFELPLDAVAEI